MGEEPQAKRRSHSQGRFEMDLLTLCLYYSSTIPELIETRPAVRKMLLWLTWTPRWYESIKSLFSAWRSFAHYSITLHNTFTYSQMYLRGPATLTWFSFSLPPLFLLSLSLHPSLALPPSLSLPDLFVLLTAHEPVLENGHKWTHRLRMPKLSKTSLTFVWLPCSTTPMSALWEQSFAGSVASNVALFGTFPWKG